MAAVGLVCGLYGWRIMRYLVVADACAVALFLGRALQITQEQGMVSPITSVPATCLFAMGLPYLAWKHPRWASIAISGIVGFLLTQLIPLGPAVPWQVGLLLGVIGASAAMATHLSLFRQGLVVVSGLHGGWFCVASLGIASGWRPGGFLASVAGAMYENVFLFPLLAGVFSTLFIALQWTDMEQAAETPIDLGDGCS